MAAKPEETLTLLYANNKGADQPVHPGAQSDQHLYDSLSGKHVRYTCLMQIYFIFWLVSVAEQTGLNFTWSETRKTSFHARTNGLVPSL